jgi:hypothetical protein
LKENKKFRSKREEEARNQEIASAIGLYIFAGLGNQELCLLRAMQEPQKTKW